jgi:hypothetical protein
VLKQASDNPISVWQLVKAKAVPPKTTMTEKTAQLIETVIYITKFFQGVNISASPACGKKLDSLR